MIAHGTPAPASPAAETRRPWWMISAVALVVIVGAHLLDHAAWSGLRYPQVYDKDWGRLLRVLGFLPTWLIVAIALWSADRPARGWGWRGGLAILAPLTGGAVAEVAKLLARRLRPEAETFGYVFRSFEDHPFSSSGFGMPSSHTLVAFAAATAMARLFPRAWGLWYLLATGCALSRVMANAHFLSDTAVAAVVGWLVADRLSHWMLGRQAAAARDEPLLTGA